MLLFVSTIQGVQFEGIERLLHGSIAICSADNLGNQELGGFQMGGSAFSVCRHCLDKVCCVHTFHCLSVMTCIPMRSTCTCSSACVYTTVHE